MYHEGKYSASDDEIRIVYYRADNEDTIYSIELDSEEPIPCSDHVMSTMIIKKSDLHDGRLDRTK